MNKIREFAHPSVVQSWVKRNVSVLSKEELIKQICSRFGYSLEQAKELLNKLSEGTTIGHTRAGFEMIKLTSEEEEDLMTFLNNAKDLDAARQKLQSGRFNRLGFLADVVKWYEEKGWVTRKQFDALKKHIFDKVHDPAYMRKHLKDMVESANSESAKIILEKFYGTRKK